MVHASTAENHSSEGFELSGPSGNLTFLFPMQKLVINDRQGVYFIIGLQGEALIEIDGRTYTFQRSTFVCLTPNHLLLLLSHSDDFRFEYLYFEYDFLSDLPLLLKADVSDKMGAMPFLPLDSSTFALLMQYYDFISNRHQSANSQIGVVKGLLFSLILEVSRIYSGRAVEVSLSRKKELTDGFLRLLHGHYKEERTTAFYAGQLCISDKYLLRVIKEVTGSTFYSWGSDFIIKEAKLLLKSTDKSVTEITEELHFPNSSFFARFFRKQTGESPMQFRGRL